MADKAHIRRVGVRRLTTPNPGLVTSELSHFNHINMVKTPMTAWSKLPQRCTVASDTATYKPVKRCPTTPP